METLVAWIILSIAAVSNGIGAYLIKLSQNSMGVVEILGIKASPLFIAGAMLFGVNLLLFARSMRDLPVAIGYPFFVGVSQTIVVIAALVLLGERLSALQAVGVAITVTGIAVLLAASNG